MCDCYFCTFDKGHPADHPVFLIPDEDAYVVCAKRTCDHVEDVELR